jgi:hypothetical protein
MILSNGATWEKLDISNFIAGQVASNIGVTATGGIQNTNVQSVLEELDTEKLNLTGGTLTGNLALNQSSSIIFEGSTPDDFETTLTVIDPTADRTVSLPNVTGTLVSSGDTGTVTSTMLLDGTILNADINASAAIAFTKLAALTSAQILVGNGSNVPTAVAVTGDISISNAGLVAITADSIVNADIKSDAAIAGSKIVAGTTSVVGVVQLTDSAASSSTTTAATPAAVKVAKDAADAAATTANAALPTTGGTLTNNLIIDNAKQIRFTEADANGANYVSLQAPDTLAADVSYTLPSAAPTANGQVLAGTTAGVLSWTDDPTGQWVTNGTNVYYDGGNVGIGTGSSPAVKLEVNGGADAIARITGTTTAARLDFKTDSYHTFVQLIESHGGLRIYDQTGTEERFRLDSSGRFQLPSSTATGYNAFDGVGRLNLNNNSADGTVDFTQGIVFTSNASNEGTWTHAGIVATGSSGYSGNLIFGTDGANSRDQASLSEKMRITADGHVGIGVTPSAWPTNADSKALQIGTGFVAYGRGSGDEDRGAIAVNYYNDGSNEKYIANGHANRIYMADGNIDFQYAAENSGGAGAALTFTSGIRMLADGKVGIGTTSPSNILHVSSGSDNICALFESTDAEAQVRIKDTTGTAILACKNDFSFENSTTGSLARITSDGKFGVGTTSPSELLHINSAATLNGLLISSTNNSTRATIEMNGKDSSGNQVELRLGGFGDTNRGEIFTVTDHAIGFATNNAAPQVILDTNGRLLIGCTTSYANASIDDLQVGNNNAATQTGITLGSTDESAIAFADAGDARAGSITYNHGSDSMIFKNNGQNTRVTIKDGGDVDVTGSLKTNNLSGRNLIVNGAMKIAQRATTSTATGIHTIDRFKHAPGGNENSITFSQANVASGTPAYKAGFRKCLKVLNGDQTQANADHLELSTTLEAQDIANSGWEYTSPSSYMTFSCWIKSSVAQAFSGSFRNIDGTVKSFKFTTPSLSIDTWTKFTVSIPGHADLSFDDNTEQGLKIYLYPYIGPTYTTAASDTETWVAGTGGNYANDMASTWWTTNTSTFEMTGWQLEVGKLATPFEHKSYGDDLRECRRYYYKHKPTATDGYGVILHWDSYGSTDQRAIIYLPTDMRAIPTINHDSTLTNFQNLGLGGNITPTGGGDTIFIADSGSSTSVVGLRINTTDTVTSGLSGILRQNNNTTAYIDFSADI